MSRQVRRLFVAGATGATGQVLVRLARVKGVEVIAHRRPKAGRAADPAFADVALDDEAALIAAMRGCSALVQLIGTMKSRFPSGDTYETSDVGTTRQLVSAAKAAGVGHVLLLSSVGAGRPVGAYLKAKAEAERIVRESGLAFTIVRPSAFVGDRHQVPSFVVGIAEALRLDTYRPIRLEQLAAALLFVASSGEPSGVLEGASLWDVVARSQRE